MRVYLIASILLFMSAGIINADEIYLKDGTVLKGKIIKVTPDAVEYDPEGDIPLRVVQKEKAVRFKYDDGKEVLMEINKDVRADGNSMYFFSSFKSNLTDEGLLRNKILLWGGIHNHLFGYTDRRYVSCSGNEANCEDIDQGDYIKTNSQQFGLDLYISDFSNIDPDLNDGRVGMSIAGYRHGKITPVTLYAVPNHNIPEETVPGDEVGFEKNPKWWYNIGLFMGLDKKWYAFDIGLTLKATIITEDKRKKLSPDSDPENPVYEEVDGRGMMFDESKVIMNMLIRLGMENRPHFTLSLNRLDYDPVYGALQGKISFPIWKYFGINTGGFLWQTQAVFIEPVVTFRGASLGYKAGVIINYHDDNFKRSGIEDSVFHSISLSYAW